MLDWDKLRVFYTVAQASSFTHAGDALHLSQSAVSRQISTLEESLGVTLFHRHARGLLLTEQGEMLLQTVRDVYAKLTSVEDSMRESKERPKGPLRITTPVAFGTMWLAPRLHEFVNTYPDIEVTLSVDDRLYDISMREADVAIRPLASSHADLIQRPLLVFHNSIYASNEYIRHNGRLSTPEDLQHHKIIAFSEDGYIPYANMNWLLEVGVTEGQKRHKPILYVSNLIAMQQAVESGLGIASLPDYMFFESKTVSRILPGINCPQHDVYFVYPSELKNSKRVAVFREFISRKMAESKF